MSTDVINNNAAFIWSIGDLLRGDYRQSEYGKVILPLVVLRRLDCVLEPTKAQVLEQHTRLVGQPNDLDSVLEQVAGQQFYNTSKLDLHGLLDDPANIADNLCTYIAGFSETARDVLDKFDFDAEVRRLDNASLLHPVLSRLCDIDLHPETVSNTEMGYLYEEVVRRLLELSNESAGEHLSPSDVIELVVNLLFVEDDQLTAVPGVVRTLFDPAAGTGRALTAAQQHVATLNDQAKLEVFGQELNAETYAICRSELMVRGQDGSHIVHGNSISNDGHPNQTFDYMLTHPPFGVEWKRISKLVEDERARLGHAGRFGAGTPRISDASFLFLQHMIAKMKPVDQGGSRIAIVFNASPLFTGAAGSGESEIRRWIIENDWLDAIVALPDQLFYNTGISTYLWILTNSKSTQRRGKVQLIDARDNWAKMRKVLGDKRKFLSSDHIKDIAHIYGGFEEHEQSRIFSNEAFGPVASGTPSWSIEPWMFVVGAEEDTHAPLDEYAAPPPRRAMQEDDLCLAVTSEGGLIATDCAERNPGRRLSPARAGDLVLTARRWVAVDEQLFPEGVDEILTTAPVLRVHDDVRERARMLALWLSSPEAGRQTPQRHSAPPRSTRVPRRIMENDSLAHAVADVIEAQDEAESFLSDLLDSPLAAGRTDPSTLAPEELHGHASRLKALVQLLQPMTDAFRRAEWSYPLQVAELARQYRLAADPVRQFEAATRLGDALTRHVGVLAAATLAYRRQGIPAEVLEHFRGGISSGSWLRLVQDAQNEGAGEILPELSEISFKKHGAGALLQHVLEIRNASAHAHGLTSTFEIDEKLQRLESLLTAALDELSWLGSTRTLLIRRVEYRHGTHQVHADMLHGSHPSWEPVNFTSAEPLEPDTVLAESGPTRLNLTPFMLVQPCSTCRRDETYILERLAQGGRLVARSLRNHDIELDPTPR